MTDSGLRVCSSIALIPRQRQPDRQTATTSDAARTLAEIRRLTAVLGVAGAVLGCVIVVSAGRMGPVVGATRLTSWLGSVAQHRPPAGVSQVPSLVMLPAMAALIALWCVTMRFFAGRLDTRHAAVVCLAWAAPFALGPPLFSNDIYSYVAQGVMSSNGIDPYTHGTTSIAGTSAFAAVDPIWRTVHSPYGPVATLIAHVAYALGGSATGAVVVLRVVAAVSLVVMAVGVAALSAKPRRAHALLIIGANPLLLFQVLSAGHLEGVMVALIVVALVVARHYPMAAIAISSVAAEVKAPAIVLTAVLVITVVRQATYGRWARPLTVAALFAAAPWLLIAFAVPNSLGWVAGLRTPGLSNTPLAPTSLAAAFIASFRPDSAIAIAPLTTAIARLLGTAAAVVLVALIVNRLRNVRLPVVAGWCLLAVAATGPVLYPWYIVWGLVPLAASKSRVRTEVVLALSVVGALMSVFGVSATVGGVFGLLTTAAYLAWLRWAPVSRDGTGAAERRSTKAVEVDTPSAPHESRSPERSLAAPTPVAGDEIRCAIEWGSPKGAVPLEVHAVDTSGGRVRLLHAVAPGAIEHSDLGWSRASSIGKRCSECADRVSRRSRAHRPVLVTV